LGVQDLLYPLDELAAVGQELLQKLDMRLKRPLAKTFVCQNPSPD
jgi:hypothetical protein